MARSKGSESWGRGRPFKVAKPGLPVATFWVCPCGVGDATYLLGRAFASGQAGKDGFAIAVKLHSLHLPLARLELTCCMLIGCRGAVAGVACWGKGGSRRSSYADSCPQMLCSWPDHAQTQRCL
jgi:hypothetical protein